MLKKWFTNQKVIFFLQNALAFAIIFITLGVMLTTFIHNTAYNQIDNGLRKMAAMPRVLIADDRGDIMFSRGQEGDRENEASLSQIGFQSQVIFWTKDHKKLTSLNNDDRGQILEQIKFSDLNEGKIQEISYKGTLGQTMYFHSYLVPFNSDSSSNIAYMQVLTNTNQVTESTNHTQNVVIFSIVIFYFLSLGVSFYLARIQMQPILENWKKQQIFVENASHELRTPLAIIQNKMETLFRKPESTILESSEEISDSLSEIRRLRHLTNDLLTLTRGENQETLEKEMVNFKEFLEKIVQEYREIAALEGKEVHFTFEKSDQETVQIDIKKVKQLLVILLDNALKYTSSGDEITVTGKVSKEIEFSVKDTGVGIADDKKKEIFDRFVRVDSSRNKHTGGFGLGLSIAKQITTALSGEIQCIDNLPKGSIFKVKFQL